MKGLYKAELIHKSDDIRELKALQQRYRELNPKIKFVIMHINDDNGVKQ